jgi:hypothetical protein
MFDPNARHLADLAGAGTKLLIRAALYEGICVFAAWTFDREAPMTKQL